MPAIDWKMRDVLHHLRDNGRLNVLMELILRANVRARCWPSIDLICKETGYAKEAVNVAKKWLVEHKAVELVPYKLRVGKERELPPRQTVYQLTGVLEIDGTVYPYLYISVGEISITEISVGEHEVVKSFKSLPPSKSRKKKEKDSLVPDGTGQSQAKHPQSSALKGKKKSAHADTSDINGANATTNPLPGSAVVSPAPRKKVLSRMERIINDAWRKGAVYLLPQLVGNAQQKGRKEWNVTPGMSESEVLAFGRWYSRNNAGLNLPEDPRKVYEAVVGFRSEEGYDALIAEATRDLPMLYPHPSDLPAPVPDAPVASREAHDAVYARLGQLGGGAFEDLFSDVPFNDHSAEIGS